MVTLVDTAPAPSPARTARGRRGDDYSHLDPLLAELSRLDAGEARHRQLRDELAVAFLPVAHHIAARYRNRGEPLEDLQQAAAVALMHALDRFEPGRGPFLGFAVPTITGEVRRHFRDRTWSMRVPRRLKDLQSSLRQATDELTTQLRRAPRPSEIAARLGISVEEVIEALHAQDSYTSASLDSPIAGTTQSLADTLGDVDAALDTIEYRQALRPILAELPERERTILVMRFFHDMTQTQIAEAVGLSQMHISRLLMQTLSAIRRRLDAD